MECPAAYGRWMTNDQERQPGAAGRRIGLGHVVDDQLSIGTPEPDDPGAGDERAIRKASEDSFPASDPPTWMSDPATPRQPADPGEREPAP